MYVIDPGRYKSHYMLNKEICQKQNTEQLRSLIEWLLYLDFIEYKPVKTKRKASMLREKIKEKAKNIPYSEFFMEELKEFENVHQYAKSLEKYIK